MSENNMTPDKTYVMQAPVMFNESYIWEFIAKALEVGHIPTEEEFEYCEKDNRSTAKIENTVLMALSFTAALNTSKHNALMEMCCDRIRDTFKLFADHGVVLTIFQDNYANK